MADRERDRDSGRDKKAHLPAPLASHDGDSSVDGRCGSTRHPDIAGTRKSFNNPGLYSRGRNTEAQGYQRVSSARDAPEGNSLNGYRRVDARRYYNHRERCFVTSSMELEDQTTQKYIRFLEVEQNASPHTVLAYRRALCDFKRFMGLNVRWRTTEPDNFRAFLSHCLKRKRKRSYIALIFAALRSLYNFLIEREGYGKPDRRDS